MHKLDIMLFKTVFTHHGALAAGDWASSIIQKTLRE